MKRTFIILCIFLSIALYGYSGDSLKFTTIPEKLELFVNQKTDPYTIHVEYILNIPQGFIGDKQRLIYIPRFTTPEHEYLLQPLVITGEKFREKDSRTQLPEEDQAALAKAQKIQYTTKAMQIKINEDVPFQLWMPQARLTATSVLQSRKSEQTFTQILAEGVVYLPLGPGPVKVKYVEKEVAIEKNTDFHFLYPANVSYLRPEFSDNSSQLKKMNNFLQQISNNPNDKIEQIVITSYCSPDGSYAYNQRLANKRVLNFIHDLGFPDMKIEFKTVPYDWQGLAAAVEKSNLSDKTNVLSIIRSNRNDTQRIAALRQSRNYNYLLTHIYPRLQRTVCDIQYTTKEMQTVPVPE